MTTQLGSSRTPPRAFRETTSHREETITSHRARLLAGVAVATCLVLGAGVAPATAQTVYGPHASYEVCWVAGNQGQQAGQWVSYFCAQNGTPQWWLFTTP